MVSLESCKCGWLNKSQNRSSSSRAAVSHLKKCSLRQNKAAETKSLSKRGISDTDMGGAEDVLLGPPQKVPRLLVVSVRNGTVCGIG
jgi:hypothetical protein